MLNNYYFFMKVGFSNCFLDIAEKIGGLWVGYAEDSIPLLDSNGACIAGEERIDLRSMVVATSDKYRKDVRIIVYGTDNLTIWKPTASLRYLKVNEGGMDWLNESIYSTTLGKTWLKEIIEKFGGVNTQAFKEIHFGSNSGFKFIPAELETVISRDKLIASIDSLAVWQNFVRNTFRPMFSLSGSKELADCHWLDQIKMLPAMKVSDNEFHEEGKFGKFLRWYLEKQINGKTTYPIPANEKLQTAISILNPAQLETAAMLLCQDLGLTVDVGLGKGLDVVDVKATCRHIADSKKKIQEVIKNLESIGVLFKPELRDMIISSRTLRIQCKASGDLDAEGEVLLLRPRGSSRENTLSLDSIKTLQNFPKLSDWLALLSHDLS
jgi:hypothetical protein